MSTLDVLREVGDECESINFKWGEQNHPSGTRNTPHSEANANVMRAVCDMAAETGCLTFRDILLEEVYEAIAEDEGPELRKELIQVAAVAATWVEAIDRRTARKVE